MIIVKVGEPSSVKMGDIWFDPTTKVTKKVIGANITTFAPMWSQVQLSTAVPSPSIGDVRVDSVTGVPAAWDGTSWIPAVPSGYVFPSLTPHVGDVWIETMSRTTYIFWNGAWHQATIPTINVPTSVTSQRPPPQIHRVSSGGPMTSVPLPGIGAPVPVAGNNGPAPVPVSFTPNPNTANVTIQGPGGDVLVKIDTLTGIITYGPNYTPDAAAQIFWRAIVGSSPRFLQSQIADLTKDLQDVSSRLAVAEGNVLKFQQLGHKLPEPTKPFDPNDSWDRAMGIIK